MSGKSAKDFFTPPEIKKKLLHLLNETKKAILSKKALYWADAGTLLGAIRHKKIIPWDDDVDLGVMDFHQEQVEKALKSLPKNLTWKPISFGYKVFFKSGGKPLYARGTLLNYTYPSLDIFIYTEKGSKIVYKSSNANKYWKSYTKDILFPLKKYKFGNTTVSGPQHPKQYLSSQYGKNWDKEGVISYNHSTNRFLKNPIKFNLKDLIIK